MKNKKPQSGSQSKIHWWQTVLPSFALLVAVASAVFTYQQIGVSRETMETDQRAWLTPTFNFSPIFTLGRGVSGTVTFTNTGKTLAKNLAVVSVLLPVSNGGQPSPTALIDFVRDVRGLLYPHDSETVLAEWRVVDQTPGHGGAVNWRPGILGGNIAQDVLAGRTYFWAYGVLSYDDVFGVSHWLRYCWGFGALSAKIRIDNGPCAGFDRVDNNWTGHIVPSPTLVSP